MANVASVFRLHLLDVGQGEAVLFDFPDGSFGLLDAGPLVSAANVIDHVETRCKAGRPFRFAAASQWDKDHIAGFVSILPRFKPAEFLLPGVDIQILEELCALKDGASGRGIARTVRDLAAGMPNEYLTAGYPLATLDGVAVWALAPSATIAGEIRQAFHPQTRVSPFCVAEK